jgi:hypothetical protein
MHFCAPELELHAINARAEHLPMTSPEAPQIADDAVRMVVRAPDGRRSAAVRIWFGPSDIYAAYRSIANIRKASIHFERPGQPEVRYIGYTSDFEKSQGRSARLQDRTHTSWKGLQFAPNYFLEFRFRVPVCELRRFVVNESPKTHWLTPPAPREASEITIISAPPTHSGLMPSMEGANPRELIAEFQLKNGRYVWIVHHHIACASPDWLMKAREAAKRSFKADIQSGKIRDILPQSRIGADVLCDDGSFAEVELAADFLRGRRRS